MPCSICGKRLRLFDKYQLLSNGNCCESCWHQAALTEGMSRHYSVADVKRRLERLNSLKAAIQKISSFYISKLEENGFCEGEDGYDLIGNENYRIVFREQILYVIMDELEYRDLYDIYNTINTFDDVENLESLDLDYQTIPIEAIQYFTKEGDVQYTTKISGGGGGGSSISGAVVGGIIAGNTGAIVGSRKKIAPITSITEEHDTTKTILKFFDKSELKTIVFRGFQVYDFLLKMIPEKDLLSVQIQASQNAQPTTNNQNICEKIRVIKNLFEEGLITEKEYNEKRQDLLNQI